MKLVIDRLSKTYPNGVHALNGVSLSIDRGMFGLLGPNGAGKSTLMRILATLQEADSGSARFGEVDVLREKSAVRRTLGYLPQEFGLYPKVAAGEMLDHFALLKGVTDRRARRELVDHLLRQTNLLGAKQKRLGGFSGGMRQRFGIAVALIGNPRLIIVDEPTAGLDPAERVRFLNLLSELGENAVVILSTHIVEDVSELCQRMAIIDRGQILLEAEPLVAMARLRGRVWRRIVEREQLVEYERRFAVISTKLLSGRSVVRIVADAAPDESWQPVEPDLEDVYFATMRRVALDPAPRPEIAAAASPPASPEAIAAPDSTPLAPQAPHSRSGDAAPPPALAFDVRDSQPEPPVAPASPEAAPSRPASVEGALSHPASPEAASSRPASADDAGGATPELPARRITPADPLPPAATQAPAIPPPPAAKLPPPLDLAPPLTLSPPLTRAPGGGTTAGAANLPGFLRDEPATPPGEGGAREGREGEEPGADPAGAGAGR